MNLKCLFGYHEWIFGDEVVTFVSVSNPNVKTEKSVQKRYCTICCKKQRKLFWSHSNWENSELEKDEVRNKKLKDIGIK